MPDPSDIATAPTQAADSPDAFARTVLHGLEERPRPAAAAGTAGAGSRAGLRKGDRVLSIDGEGSETMSVADAIQRLRGEAESSVGVSVLRPATGERLDVVIVRAAIVR